MALKKILLITIFFILSLFFWTHVYAETIYFYKDKKGILHFTDLPTSNNYKPYISEYSLISKQEIKDIVKKYCKELGVDYILILAILKVESNFNVHAVSNAGAQGLMQIMPITQEDLKIYSPYDPEENIRGGIRYIKKLLQKYKDIRLAIAAYNAGPGIIDKYGKIPPYRETQKYVKKVLREYKRLKRSLIGKK